MSGYLSRYTPSLMSAETLEAIFVQRQELAAQLMENIIESATTKNKHYALLYGGRGMGKTHLVSLVYHRVRRHAALRNALHIAWLKEEEWGIANYLDLLRAILRALLEEQPGGALAQAAAALTESNPQDAEKEAERLIETHVGDKTLLLIAENLEDIFEALGTDGQERFRAFLQNTGCCTILATSQSLFHGVQVRTSPFYGFFQIHHLPVFGVEDAMALLRNIADRDKDAELRDLLQTPKGRARVRALHHLAAGNPRVYVIFSQFLTAEALDRLVEPLMQTLDDLTPYYQSRMRCLSPQQRKIVEYLCLRRHAVPVAEIAKDNFITHQTASSQLKKLRGFGYVRATAEGRESYYELHEPLMRIALEVKRMRGEPVQLLVEFLRIWYSHDELSSRLDLLRPEAELERAYLTRAIESKRTGENRVLEACLRDYGQFEAQGDYEKALEVTEELLAHDQCAENWERKAWCLSSLNRDEEALQSCEEGLQLEPGNALLWNVKGLLLNNRHSYLDAIKSFNQAIKLNPLTAPVWGHKGHALSMLDRHEEALECYARALEIDPTYTPALRRQGLSLLLVGRTSEALRSLETAIELKPKSPDLLTCNAIILSGIGRACEALEYTARAVDLAPEYSFGWKARAILLGELGQYDEALDCINRAIALGATDSFAFVSRGELHFILGLDAEAIESYEQARRERAPWTPFLDFDYALALMFANRWDAGLEVLENAIKARPKEGAHAKSSPSAMRDLLARTRDVATWEQHIPTWVDVFAKQDALPLLGAAVPHSIRAFHTPQVTAEVARAWRDTWRKLAGGHDALHLPLRLLDAAVAYKEKPGKKPLLGLAVEERKILEDLLRLPQEARVQ